MFYATSARAIASLLNLNVLAKECKGFCKGEAAESNIVFLNVNLPPKLQGHFGAVLEDLLQPCQSPIMFPSHMHAALGLKFAHLDL